MLITCCGVLRVIVYLILMTNHKTKSTSEYFIEIIDLVDDSLSELKDKEFEPLPPTFENLIWFSAIVFGGIFFIALLLLAANTGTASIVAPIFTFSLLITLTILLIYLYLRLKIEILAGKRNGLGKHLTKNRSILDAKMLQKTSIALDNIPISERKKFISAMEYRISYETTVANFCLSLMPLLSISSVLLTTLLGKESQTTNLINNIQNFSGYSILVFASALVFGVGIFIKFYLSPKWIRYKSSVNFSLT